MVTVLGVKVVGHLSGPVVHRLRTGRGRVRLGAAARVPTAQLVGQIPRHNGGVVAVGNAGDGVGAGHQGREVVAVEVLGRVW